jgi:succinate dehydrogenase / fumarate reductase membrane anchor subunit
MALSVLGLWYHALGGVRHLIWDTGRGLDVESSDRMGWGMLIGSVVADLPDPDRDLRGKDMAYVTDRKRVTGLGTAKSGTHHFWTMTVTAVALFVLTPFFLGVIGPLLGAPHEEVIASLSRPVLAAIVAAYLVVGMHHFKLGVTTLIEDYVRGLARKIWIIAMTIVSYGIAAAGLVALAQIAL